MRILMLGWEFPPFHSGGLGVASKGLSEALVEQGTDITFVLPRKVDIRHNSIKFLFADIPYFKDGKNKKGYSCYTTSTLLGARFTRFARKHNIYLGGLMDAIVQYAIAIREIASGEDFDVIHAHDWLTYLAGIEAKKASGKPLIIHVHATSFDQSGRGPVNPQQFKIEKEAMDVADLVVTVSNYTRDTVIKEHGIDPDKVRVVYNGVTQDVYEGGDPILGIERLKEAGNKIVLYLGRMTIQKGPDYFLRAAKRTLEYYPNAYFIMNGEGEMKSQMIEEAAWLGIADRVIFSEGFGEQAVRLFKVADLYVMPSVSEPFGIVALESLLSDTPVILSKQSGVSEVLKHALRVDFWDTDEMANKMVSVLQNGAMTEQLKEEGRAEALSMTWHKAASKCKELYEELISIFKIKKASPTH